MSRSAKDENLHDLQGTTSRAGSAPAPRFDGGRPTMPVGLTDLEKSKWREMVRLLAARGTLTKADGPALELYVATWSRWRKCLEEIDKYGVLVTVDYAGAGGEACSKRIPNPASKLAAQLEVSLRQLLKELGSTPASRDKTRPARPDPTRKQPPKPGTAGALRPDLFQDGPGDPNPILL
jgi:P27 family predicted phage terminase small subunit